MEMSVMYIAGKMLLYVHFPEQLRLDSHLQYYVRNGIYFGFYEQQC